jgi:hypothetical protein
MGRGSCRQHIARDGIRSKTQMPGFETSIDTTAGESLWRQFAGGQIILGRNSKRICHAIEKRKQRGHVHRFSNLVFSPSRIAQLLYIVRCGASGIASNQLGIVQQDSLGRSQSRLLQLAGENGLYALVCCSLNTQEVSMAVQSIRTPVQVGDVARDHLLVAPRKVPFGKMHGIRKFDNLPKKVGTRTEALDDSRHLLPS